MNPTNFADKGRQGAGVRAPGDRPSRREVLSPAAIVAALWAGTSDASAVPGPTDPLRWLVHHVTQGLTESEFNTARSRGYLGYLEYQLNHTTIDDSALDARVDSTTYPTLFMTPDQLALPSVQARQVVDELMETTILRSVLSKRQLYQRMVEFWTDHFNIFIDNGIGNKLKTVDDREVIRANALGTFPAMLTASAQSPAMLVYLDNFGNTVRRPNENYARELLELHTLGVDGGYTQQDVVDVARCFTGWTFYPANAGTNAWRFRFLPENHDNGQKTVLGHVIAPGGGITDGFDVISILSNHPSTARLLAEKMCKWLLGYRPSPALVDAVASTYLNPPPPASRGDIKSMIRAILLSREASDGTARKYKRPYHHMMAALRATGASITSTTAIRTPHLLAAGQVPYSWSAPDGYPDTLDYWVGLILPRWNFGAALLHNKIGGATVDIDAFLAGADTAGAVMDRIETAIFGGIGGMNPRERSLIANYLLPDPPTTGRKRDAVGLAIGSPSFQWY